MVTTAVKNHPSNRASFDCTARTQRSMSSYTPVSLPGGTDKTWRECDTIPPSVTLGEGEGALSRSSKNHTDWLRGQLQALACNAVSQQLLTHVPTAAPRPSIENSTAEQLSSRELAVLRLIAQGCSNQEISEQLFISLHTVKTHASHINSKLGVERRTQAVARAKELGLLY